jgi:hypothetical protein
LDYLQSRRRGKLGGKLIAALTWCAHRRVRRRGQKNPVNRRELSNAPWKGKNAGLPDRRSSRSTQQCNCFNPKEVAGSTRLELATSGVTGRSLFGVSS